MDSGSATLYFDSRRNALEFGRELKLATHARNIVATGHKVRIPACCFEQAKRVYLDFVKRLAERPVEVGVVGATTLMLLSGHADHVAENSLVLEAIRRSNHSLADATSDEIGSYLSELSPNALSGLVNNVKGIYHEMLYVEAENGDADNWHATLMPEANNPGSDVVLTNLSTGESVEIQLKATDSEAYIREHISRYPEIAVASTSNSATESGVAIDTGITNSEVTSELDTQVGSLVDGSDMAGEALGDAVLGGMFGVGIAAAASSGARDGKVDVGRAAVSGLLSAGFALLTGIVF